MNSINLSLFKAMTQNMAKTLLVAVALSAAPHTATATTHTFEASANNSMKNAASNASGFRGLDDVVGLTLDHVKENAVDAGKYPEDLDKIFFLYNVKTEMFINAGGYWGTHISLKDYPMLLWVNTNSSKYGDQTIELAQNMDTGQGHLLGWVSSDKDPADTGVFIDRSTTKDGTHYGWTFEPVNDAKNTYRIYTYTTNNPQTSGESQSTKYYLCANKGSVDQDKNCGAFSEQTISSKGLSGYDTWRIMSMQQIFELQKLNSDDMTSPLDMSFLLKCPGFKRGNQNIDKWKIKNFGVNGGVRYGLERMYNKTNKVTSNGTSDTYDVENIKDNPYTFDGTK